MKNPPIYAWLKANLGKGCLAPLTSTDAKALIASVAIVELYAYNADMGLFGAWGAVVQCMQPHTVELAYHAVAHVINWEDRRKFWEHSGLIDCFPEMRPRICAWEPGGSR